MSSKKNLGIVAVVITFSYITLSAFNGAEKQNEIAATIQTVEKATINEMPPVESNNPQE